MKLGLFLHVLIAVTALAQPFTQTNVMVGRQLLDGNLSGMALVQSIASPVAAITKLKVNLRISGTFNGDLYAYLNHGNTHVVLLNRPGRRATSNLGYPDDGLNIRLADGATDIHSYRDVTFPFSGSPLTGEWGPDGRTNSPLTVLDTDERRTALRDFNGADPNGEWILFLADIASGDLQTIDEWGLIIEGEAPHLAVAVAQDSLLLTWRGSGYHLQESDNSTEWVDVKYEPSVLDLIWRVRLPLGGFAKFYRLHS